MCAIARSRIVVDRKPEKPIEQNLLGGHRDVRLEFARPPTSRNVALRAAIRRWQRARHAVFITTKIGASRAAAAADGRLHRIRPAGIGPRPGDRDVADGGGLRRPPNADSRQVRSLGVARDGGAAEICRAQRGQKCSNFTPRKRLQIRRTHPKILVGRTAAAAQIPGRLLEDPLQRRSECGGKVETEACSIVPEMHVNDRDMGRTPRDRRRRNGATRPEACRECAAAPPPRRHRTTPATRRAGANSTPLPAASTATTAVERKTASSSRAAAAAKRASGTVEKPKRAAPASFKNAVDSTNIASRRSTRSNGRVEGRNKKWIPERAPRLGVLPGGFQPALKRCLAVFGSAGTANARRQQRPRDAQLSVPVQVRVPQERSG